MFVEGLNHEGWLEVVEHGRFGQSRILQECLSHLHVLNITVFDDVCVDASVEMALVAHVNPTMLLRCR